MTLTSTVPAYRTFDLEVAAVQRLSPTFVRVTLSGADLVRFHTGGPLGLRDTRVKLVVPPAPGTRSLTAIDVTDPAWYRRWLAVDPADRGHLRTYTVRRLDLTGPTALLSVDFALHVDAHGRGGPATAWAAGAQVGDPLTLLGPNAAHPDPGGLEWRPPGPDVGPQPVLLVGDETALPAIGGILEALPDRYAGEVLVEVPGIDDAQQLAGPPGVRVTYLARNDARRGAPTLAHLPGALSRLGLAAGGIPAEGGTGTEADLLWEPADGPTGAGIYAWVAGEASVVRDVRRVLVQRVPRERVAFMGYWRQGRAEG